MALRPVNKVTCLITRRADGGDEVVVFDHPLAGVQLPAGTTLPGEGAVPAALREGWEETGIPRLEMKAELMALVEATPGCGHGRLAVDTLVGGQPFTRGHGARVLETREDELLVEVVDSQGWIPAAAYCDEVVRHIVQLESDASTPTEWWVVTPDGGGLCWRCRWVPLDGDIGLVDGQVHWVTDVRDRLEATTPARPFRIPDHPLCNDTSHVQFWALPGVEKRFVVSWVPSDIAVDDSMVRRALVAPRASDGRVVVVSGDGRTMWNFPGGGRERGEAIEDTARREVREEACATVTDLHLLGYQHLLHLDDDDNVVDEELQARFAAHVRIEPWSEAFEIGARRLVSLDEVRASVGVWWQPEMLERILAGAVAAWGP